MRDPSCIDFLQRCLPLLNYRWRGFKKVRRQVCRRIQRRLQELELGDIDAYQSYLITHSQEWRKLDACCDISISRFYRDKRIFDTIADSLLPTLAGLSQQQGQNQLRCWSLGCCSGEEPFSLSLIWHLSVAARVAGDCHLKIIATDRNPLYLQRARAGSFASSSLKDLPPGYVEKAFTANGEDYRLKQAYRADVELLQQDIRYQSPAVDFDLVCCRNLVFTYFSPTLQQKILNRICTHLHRGGFLVIGAHEQLPTGHGRYVTIEG